MKTFWLPVFCLTTVFAIDATADNASKAAGTPQGPPAPPLVAPQLPIWCQWTVDYTYSSTAQGSSPTALLAAYKKMAAQDPLLAKMMANPQFIYSLVEPRPLHTLVVRTGEVRHEVRNLERGFMDDRWTLGDAMVDKKPESPQPIVTLIGASSNSEFPEFNWISTSNFTGRKKVNGVDCLVFQQKLNPLEISNPDRFADDRKGASGPRTAEDEETFVQASAYVADQTRLPVMLETPTETRHYAFLLPPAEKLAPPALFLDAAHDAKARVDASTRPLSPP